jgi:hypothetical protein
MLSTSQPTAPAPAYGLTKIRDDGTVVVYVLGGVTFDVRALTLSRGVFEDNVLLDRLVQTFEKEYATDLGEGRFALQRQRFVQYGGNKSRFANQNLNISTHAAFLYFSRLVRPVWHWNITISRRGNFIDPLFLYMISDPKVGLFFRE